MNKKISILKLGLSLIIGTAGMIIGIVPTIGFFYYLFSGQLSEIQCYGPFECLVGFIGMISIFFLIFGTSPTGLPFTISMFLSPVGIFLARKFLNSSHRKLAIFAILINSINLIFLLIVGLRLSGFT